MTKKAIAIVFTSLLILALASGCSSVKHGGYEVGGDAAKSGEQQPSQTSTTTSSEAIQSSESGIPPLTKAQKASMPEIIDVRFDYDRYEIRPEFREFLSELADWLISSRAVVLIEGHCDERGTNEYNLALGDRRAVSVKDFLLASGVPFRQLETISFGEERPICEESEDACWSKNRRAHLKVGGMR